MITQFPPKWQYSIIMNDGFVFTRRAYDTAQKAARAAHAFVKRWYTDDEVDTIIIRRGDSNDKYIN